MLTTQCSFIHSFIDELISLIYLTNKCWAACTCQTLRGHRKIQNLPGVGTAVAPGRQEPRYCPREQRTGEGLTLGLASMLPEVAPPSLSLTKAPSGL